MKMAKKLLAVALAGVLAVSVLTGCGNSVSGKSLVDALKKMDVNVEYDSKLNDTAKTTLAAIETIVDSKDNKELAEDKQVTLDNAVGVNGKVISVFISSYIKNIKEDSETKPVSNALEIVTDGVNAGKKVQVALFKTEKITSNSDQLAARIKDNLIWTSGSIFGNYKETGNFGYAKTKDGKYMLVVIVNDKKD